MNMKTQEAYERLYGRIAADTVFTPYRVCPVGAHVDHNLGKITGFAIDKGIYLSYTPRDDGTVEVSSLEFEGRKSWTLADIPKVKQNDWADHLRGACAALKSHYPLRVGLEGVISGELPIGGLSSSAAVIISFLTALIRVNGIALTPAEMINISRQAENEYVGVACGKLDQSCEVYCREGKLLYLDTKDDSYELIGAGKGMKPYEIAVFFSGLTRSLAGSKYNMRSDELRAAAYSLLAYAGMDYGKFTDTNMRDVPREVYDRYRDRLPENHRKRADHYMGEMLRVEQAAQAWRNGDIEAFGKTVFESGYSSIYNYETGSDELKTLYEIMTRTHGIYGGRFSGAGFKGCCMALIDPAYEEEILRKVEKEYLAAYPELKGKYSACICRTADGVKL